LTPEQMSYYRGKQYALKKKHHRGGGDRKSAEAQDQKPHNEAFDNTAHELAVEHKVSKATIERDAVYAKAIDTLADVVGPEARHSLLARDTNVTQQDVKALAKMAKEHPTRVTEALAAVQEVKTPKQARQIVRKATGEVREYEQYMDAMARSDGLADWPHPAPPAVQQKAWTLVYIDELGRRLTNALQSLDRLHAHLTSQQSEELVVQLPDLLEHQAALGIKLGECWGHVETLLLRSATVRQGLGRLSPAPAPDATLPPLGDGADPDCPAFDTAKFVLGKLCKGGHEHGKTGQSLLRRSGRYCGLCNAALKRQQRRQPAGEVPA
jgi:hypothetical protein